MGRPKIWLLGRSIRINWNTVRLRYCLSISRPNLTPQTPISSSSSFHPTAGANRRRNQGPRLPPAPPPRLAENRYIFLHFCPLFVWVFFDLRNPTSIRWGLSSGDGKHILLYESTISVVSCTNFVCVFCFFLIGICFAWNVSFLYLISWILSSKAYKVDSFLGRRLVFLKGCNLSLRRHDWSSHVFNFFPLRLC